MAEERMSAARVRTILKRQFPPRWGPRYVPSQLATIGEKSRKSKAIEAASSLLQRDLHGVARTEKSAISLALYHPKLFEFKEQHALSPGPYAHPLVGHPKASGLILPQTQGTVVISERLGLLAKHPKAIERADGTGDGTARWIPAPLLRDQLLFLEDDRGPYCVSWDVKDRRGDHGMPGPGTYAERTSPRRIANAQALDAIYCEYMRELGIRIVRVAKEDIDRTLRINLQRLFGVHAQSIELGPQVHAELLDAFADALRTGRPPNEVIDDFVRSGVDGADAKRVLEQAIWHRRIRIDLFSHWSIDQPLVPERRDPIEVYADWFRR